MPRKKSRGQRSRKKLKMTVQETTGKNAVRFKAKVSAQELVNCQTIIEFQEGWCALKDGIDKMIAILEESSNLPLGRELYMTLYTVAYTMCTQKPPHDYSKQLYERYCEFLSDHMTQTVLPSLQNKHGVRLLEELSKRWGNHCVMRRWLCRFFQYLDRYYCPRYKRTPLERTAVECFRDLVYKPMSGKLRDAVLTMIHQERQGEKVEQAILRVAVSIFEVMGLGELNIYNDDFEKAMLENTSSYYANEAAKHVNAVTFPEYMLMVENCLKREDDRARSYLHANTYPELMKVTRHQLLLAYQNQLLEKEHSGLDVLLRDGKVEDLKRMYELFSSIDGGLEPIISLFKNHITESGIALVQKATGAVQEKNGNNRPLAGAAEHAFTIELFQLHEKYKTFILDCFRKDIQFCKALKVAFEIFCNKDICCITTSEILATFADNILKKGGGVDNLRAEVVEFALHQIVVILGFVHGKDLFAEFYRTKLAHRLLFDRSSNQEIERSFLTKLKQQNGSQFTSKMEGMINDMILARENLLNFQKFLESCKNGNSRVPSIDMAVTVLTTGFWPAYKPSDLYLPIEMVNGVEFFMEFYKMRNKSRKISWIYSLGFCNMIGHFDQKPIELVVTTNQAAALMLFNDSERLSFDEIRTQLNLPFDEVFRMMHSLTCAKCKILKKECDTKIVSKDDIFEFNSNFTDRMTRIKVPWPLCNEKRKVIEDVVDEDRRFSIDAAVVRIMKSRKVLAYQQLVSEAIQQLSHVFEPDVRMLKKRIEDLVEREFFERDANDANTLKYIA